MDKRDVGRKVGPAGETQSGLIDEDRGVRAECDLRGDLGKIKVHRLDVAARQDGGRTIALLRTDRAENAGRGGSPVV